MASHPKPARARRRPFLRRPWVRNSQYDRMAQRTVLHADLYAFDDGRYVIEYHAGGLDHVRSVPFMLSPHGTLEPCSNLPLAGTALTYWTRSNHHVMRAIHPALLERARSTFDAHRHYFTRLSIHCHYLRVEDTPAFPREMLNHWKPRAKAGEAGTPTRPRGRPRKDAQPAVGALPDWL